MYDGRSDEQAICRRQHTALLLAFGADSSPLQRDILIDREDTPAELGREERAEPMFEDASSRIVEA